MGWVEAIGASGTIRCVANIVKENEWSDDGVITLKSINKLMDEMAEAGHVDKLEIAGLNSERASVLPGGVVVLKAAFERLKIDRMIVSDGALREGLLYDLLGRIQHDDERDRTVLSLAKRYQTDEPHAQRIETMATQLFEQVSEEWKLEQSHLDCLKWAAKLHEIGLAISHNSFHKHSSYLIDNSVLSGFSREEQHVLATIVLGQRRKFPKKEIKKLPDEVQKSSKRLTILLRLAMVFNRGRTETADTFVKLKVKKKGLRLRLPNAWLAEHPLTKSDLFYEADYLEEIGFKLKIKDF